MLASFFSFVLWMYPAAIGPERAVPTQQRPAPTPAIFFVPTLEAIADEMLKLAGVKADAVVYDLGSGDGRIVSLAAQKSGARGVGTQPNPRLAETSRQHARDAVV